MKSCVIFLFIGFIDYKFMVVYWCRKAQIKLKIKSLYDSIHVVNSRQVILKLYLLRKYALQTL